MKNEVDARIKEFEKQKRELDLAAEVLQEINQRQARLMVSEEKVKEEREL